MRTYALIAGGTALLTLCSGVLLMDCASDSRESQSVTVISSCDLTQLDTSTPKSNGSTIKVYVETGQAFSTAVSNASKQLMQICNTMDTDLGLQTGTDVTTACAPIAKRTAACIANYPAFFGQNPPWFNFSAPPTCKVDPNVEAQCLATCAGACSPSKCTGTLAGTCSGKCTGTCATTGKNVACNGACQGTCSNQQNQCSGECAGFCYDGLFAIPNANTFMPGGACDQACYGGRFEVPANPFFGPFFGTCPGTCTGQCDGMDVNGGFPAPDAGKPPKTVPNNAPGNCPFPHQCTGYCDTGDAGVASGVCEYGCPGNFGQGVCTSPCNGPCISGAGSGCTQTAAAPDAGAPVACDGTCLEDMPDGGGTCMGVCQGKCDTAVTDAVNCNGSLNCGQNTECGLACQAKAAISIACTPPDAVEVEAVTDPALYAEFKKVGPQLAVVLQTIASLRVADGEINQRTLADFSKAGLIKTDLDSQCIDQGQTAISKAHTALQNLVAADPTIVQ